MPVAPNPGKMHPDSRFRLLLKPIVGARRAIRTLRRLLDPAALLDPIPGVGWLIRSFVRTPGSFLFTAELLAWLDDPTKRLALPPLYRFFAWYCRALPRNSRGVAFGSEWVFHCAAWCTRRFGLRDEAELCVDSHVVWLSLTDARALAVPNEIHSVRALLGDFLRRGDTFVDVGANHGSYSLVASRLAGAEGRVVTVEPQPRLAQLVRRSLEATSASPFSVYEMAFSDEAGEATFYVPRATSGAAGLFRSYSARSAALSLQVRVGRFDDQVNLAHLPRARGDEARCGGLGVPVPGGGARGTARPEPLPAPRDQSRVAAGV